MLFNSWTPGRCGNIIQNLIFKLIIQKSTRCEFSVRWIPQNLTNEKSKLVQVMAWCLQATSHYLRSWANVEPDLCRHMVSRPQVLKHGKFSPKYSQETGVSLWVQSVTYLICSVFAIVNLLGPSDATWRHRTESTVAQVMACCLTAPSHYLNQCWLIISKFLWHPSEGRHYTKKIWRDQSVKQNWKLHF